MTRFPKLFNSSNSSSVFVLLLLIASAVPTLIAQDSRPPQAAIDVPGVWTLVATTGPQARFTHAMAFDVGRRKVVLFGGSDLSSNRFGDTWEWDGTAWLQVSSTGPSGRANSALVYNSAKHRTLLFGGTGTSGDPFKDNNDSWVWDGTTWTQIILSHVPPARNSPGLAYDIGRQQVVLFGGGITLVCDPLRDTWELGSAGWKERLPVIQPHQRNSTSMVYDTLRSRSLLFGGQDNACGGTDLSGTWEWDGNAWMEAATTGPSVRRGVSMAYDNARHRVILFGGAKGSLGLGDTWEWDGVSWTKVATTGPSPRIYSAAAYDGVSRTVVLFGGDDTFGNLLGDTWAWSGPIYTCNGRTPGDLNCDRVVDGDDLSILQSAGTTPAYGPADPRDLNHDGQITAADAQQLVRLCTNSDCS